MNMLILPELIVIGTAFLILIFDLFFSSKQSANTNASYNWTTVISIGGLIAAVFATLPLYQGSVLYQGTPELFGGRLAIDSLGLIFKDILLGSTLLLVLLSPAAFNMRSKTQILNSPEFFAILLFALSGMMFLVSSRDLITLYVSLELATIPLFALTAWAKSSQSGEAAIKYLVIGALGSAFLLYGLGFLYALIGSASVPAITAGLKVIPPQLNMVVLFAAALLTVGVSFKLTLFPFHMWAPDAYQGAPTPVTAFLSVVSKTTGLILAFQIFIKLFATQLPQWTLGVAVLATLTMSLGNLVAIRQSNLKRFIAFSSISQAGYLIMGFLSMSPESLSAMVFYILIYALTNLAAFGVIILHIHQSGNENIESLKGLSITNPLLALALMIALFGLAGIPPLAGFIGKFFLFNIAAKSGLYWLVAVAAVNSTVSLYYYLRLVRQMYIEAPDTAGVQLRASPLTIIGLSIASFGSVAVGFIPQIYEGILSVTSQWLH
jgi:NADH-quinone oxidoreductase subunit N